MIHHHLNDEMILAYAAGTLPVGLALVVACHLEVCPHCAARLAQAEAVGGAMIENSSTSACSDDLFDKILDEINGADRSSASKFHPVQSAPQSNPVRPIKTGGAIMPSMLSSILGDDMDAIKWRAAGPGVKQHVVPLDGTEGETVRLLKLSPGFVTPEHSHHGSELTMVLQGSFHDESGRYRVGDIQDADDSVHHQPIADTDEDCICLTVTEAPLEFKGVITRLLQPIIGI